MNTEEVGSMGFWDSLFAKKEKKSVSARAGRGFISFEVKCGKCGEEIKIMVRRTMDLQNLYLESGEKGAAYRLKKEILGKNCPNLINITVDFDRSYAILSRDISGGEFAGQE
ncbi:MAG: hypothetical protein V3U04_06390 [Candidatus Aerophobetes bacterium]